MYGYIKVIWFYLFSFRFHNQTNLYHSLLPVPIPTILYYRRQQTHARCFNLSILLFGFSFSRLYPEAYSIIVKVEHVAMKLGVADCHRNTKNIVVFRRKISFVRILKYWHQERRLSIGQFGAIEPQYYIPEFSFS